MTPRLFEPPEVAQVVYLPRVLIDIIEASKGHRTFNDWVVSALAILVIIGTKQMDDLIDKAILHAPAEQNPVVGQLIAALLDKGANAARPS